MNPLLHAEMSTHRSADVARNMKRHRPAAAESRSVVDKGAGHRFARLVSAVRPLRHAA